jgi:hypothetical protein
LRLDGQPWRRPVALDRRQDSLRARHRQMISYSPPLGQGELMLHLIATVDSGLRWPRLHHGSSFSGPRPPFPPSRAHPCPAKDSAQPPLVVLSRGRPAAPGCVLRPGSPRGSSSAGGSPPPRIPRAVDFAARRMPERHALWHGDCSMIAIR